MPSYLLLETGDRLTLQDGGGRLYLRGTAESASLAGTVAGGGAVSRAAGKPSVGSLDTGTAVLLARSAARPIAGTLTPSGVLSAARALFRGLASLVTPSGLWAYVTGTVTPATGGTPFRPAAPQRRSFSMYQRSQTKRAGERRLYVFDFRRYPEIEQGETIESAAVAAVAGLTIESVAVTAAAQLVGPSDTVPAGAGVQAFISGGVAGTGYEVSCEITTSGGAELVVTGTLSVVA